MVKLDIENWKYFKLSELFEVSKTKNINSDDLNSSGSIPYVTRTAINNGVEKKVSNASNFKLNKGNCIIIGGESAYSFYQENDFLSGNNISTIRGEHINLFTGLYLCTILNLEHYRYSYGRAWTKTCINLTKIKLPAKLINGKFEPDWEKMEKEIKDIYISKQQSLQSNVSKSKLIIPSLKEFKIGYIFRRINVKKYSSIPQEAGTIPFVTSTSLNNGVSFHCSNVETIVQPCITISTNGNCFDCFFHDEKISISTDVEAITVNEKYRKYFNKYNALFMITVMKLNTVKFNFGRKPKGNHVFESTLHLPAKNVNGKYEPDWESMENYIKKLQNSDLI